MHEGVIVLVLLFYAFALIVFGGCLWSSATQSNYLVVASIFKNESDYLNEWLSFYISQGVDHFYLYDNNDQEEEQKKTQRILKKYKRNVTCIPWTTETARKPVRSLQSEAYHHCVQTQGKNFQWILLADIDEFAFATNSGETLQSVLKKHASDTHTPFVNIPRYNFGSNGHKTKPSGTVVENYTTREASPSSMKTISNIKFIVTDPDERSGSVHHFLYTTSANGINPKMCVKPRRMAKLASDRKSKSTVPLQMNHYYTKSYGEFISRCQLWTKAKTKINMAGRRTKCNLKEFKKKNVNQVSDTVLKNKRQ